MQWTIAIPVLFLNVSFLQATPFPEDHEKAALNSDYFVHVILSGVVKDMIFPGPPNFMSTAEGDWEEPRWILDIDRSSLVRLVEAQARMTDDHYMGEFINSELRESEPDANLVTLDSAFTGEINFMEHYNNKRITIDAVISAQPAHCHTTFVVEISKVLSCE